MRNVRQAQLTCSVSDQPPLSDELELKLRQHAWARANWFKGKDYCLGHAPGLSADAKTPCRLDCGSQIRTISAKKWPMDD